MKRDAVIAIQDGRQSRGGVNLDQVSTPQLYVAKIDSEKGSIDNRIPLDIDTVQCESALVIAGNDPIDLIARLTPRQRWRQSRCPSIGASLFQS